MTIDTAAADALVGAARANRLLGAEVLVTGVRPGVAWTLVALGTAVLGDRKAGIRHTLAHHTAPDGPIDAAARALPRRALRLRGCEPPRP